MLANITDPTELAEILEEMKAFDQEEPYQNAEFRHRNQSCR
ncbi:hypothetical protein [Anaerotignum sp.]